MALHPASNVRRPEENNRQALAAHAILFIEAPYRWTVHIEHADQRPIFEQRHDQLRAGRLAFL